MTADDIIINSTNFSVDTNGDMTCSNATVTGGNVAITDDGLGNYEGKIRITGNVYNNGMYSDGIVIRRKNSATDSTSPNSIFMFMYEDDPRLIMTSTNTVTLRVQKTGFNYMSDYGKGFYCDRDGNLGVSEKVIAPEVVINGEGSAMYGKDSNDHKYRCEWTGSRLNFWVDDTNVGTLSDARLKTEIEDIDEDFINAIKEIEMKQFKVANRNGLVSFGILAQDLIEIFERYNKNPFDYEIVQETKYRTDDETIYYTINYEQFLILKTKAQEIEIKQLQEKDKQKDKLLKELVLRIEKIEKGE